MSQFDGLEHLYDVQFYSRPYLPSDRVAVYRSTLPLAIKDVLGTNYVLPNGIVVLFVTRFGTFASSACFLPFALRQLHSKLNLYTTLFLLEDSCSRQE